VEREVVASNLAREGLDVIRMMRDSNWLSNTATFGLCAPPDDVDRDCYPGVFQANPYPVDASGAYEDNQRLRVQLNAPLNDWRIQGGNNFSQIRLYTDASGIFSHESSGTITNYARQIIISFDESDPPYKAVNPAMNVKSIVVWDGRNCTAVPNDNTNVNLSDTAGPQAFITACKTIVEETMTNWKDYK